MATLHLWIENQPGDCDCTAAYLRAAGFVPAAGVAYDGDAGTLSGVEPEAVYAEYRRAARLVADAGHGDVSEADAAELGEPVLTACPADLIEAGYRSAGESLARLESRGQATWAGLVAAVPSLRP